MVKVTIDGVEVEAENGMTIIQACEIAGIEIPRFCYHERLAIAGNCRMCLVDVEKSPKPVASCAMPVMDGMVVHTDTPRVKKAREGVMEFLLINHPLDCPICDQGGECDLQDQAMAYGSGKSRYDENKRAVPEKYMGPLIKTQMTRCIHCTRCVRFAQDIAGVPEIGAIGRGEHMEITTYLDRAVSSELSGNVIDLCPVGALTSRPYAFHARSWELEHTESVDVMDAVGSNIRIDRRGREVMRILPRLNEDVNEEWISDKTRFSCDGLKLQRLDRPMLRRKGKFEEVSWDEAFAAVAEKLAETKASKIAAIAGDLVDAESMFALKKLMQLLGVSGIDCRQDGAKLESGSRAAYIFNTTISGIEQSDACLLIGVNPRLESSIINARLRKRYLKGGFSVYNIGAEVDLTYPVEQIGSNPSHIAKAVELLKKHSAPMLIIGQGALAREDGAQILSLARDLAEKSGMVKAGWNGFNVLHNAASRVAGLDMGFVPADKNALDVADVAAGKAELVYLLGADEVDVPEGAFVVYQGHHGDRGAHRADVIFPGAAYTEKHGTYVNTEGRAQLGFPAVPPPGSAKEDWKIIRALSGVVGKPLVFDNLNDLRAVMIKEVPSLGRIDEIIAAEWKEFGSKGEVTGKPFDRLIKNFYMTNAISRASKTMAECVRALENPERKAA